MPEILENCVKKLIKKGYSKDRAYSICVKQTGIKPKKGGGWTKGKKENKR